MFLSKKTTLRDQVEADIMILRILNELEGLGGTSLKDSVTLNLSNEWDFSTAIRKLHSEHWITYTPTSTGGWSYWFGNPEKRAYSLTNLGSEALARFLKAGEAYESANAGRIAFRPLELSEARASIVPRPTGPETNVCMEGEPFSLLARIGLIACAIFTFVGIPFFAWVTSPREAPLPSLKTEYKPKRNTPIPSTPSPFTTPVPSTPVPEQRREEPEEVSPKQKNVRGIASWKERTNGNRVGRARGGDDV